MELLEYVSVALYDFCFCIICSYLVGSGSGGWMDGWMDGYYLGSVCARLLCYTPIVILLVSSRPGYPMFCMVEYPS